MAHKANNSLLAILALQKRISELFLNVPNFAAHFFLKQQFI